MAPAARPLNAVEQKIHLACLANEKKMLGQKDIDVLVPDVKIRVEAINFLLSTGMLKMMAQDGGKQISYKAVMKKEMDIKKEMGGDENMVLSHIQASGNEGIWTKHLKGKTELHQTVINRCLKSLEQKGLIKAVKSVKYPTRKIYMMSHLEPSVEVTGGPWYSENELDIEFIKALMRACLRFIQDKSFPKTSSSEATLSSGSSGPLYPISQSSSYPTSKTVHNWLQKSRLTEQELGVEHVEMLLDVLVFDGEIERLPAYGADMWDMDVMDVEDDEDRRERKRKREKSEEGSRKKKSKRKKRSRKTESSEEDSEEDSRKKKKRRVKDESDADEDDDHNQTKNKQKGRHSDGSDSDSGSTDDRRRRKKARKTNDKSSRHKARSRSRRRSRSSTSSDSGSDSESDDSDASRTKRKRRSSRHRSKSKSKSAFDVDSGDSDVDGLSVLKDVRSANVYRAVRQERVSLGWSQAPCGRCPVFDFCHPSGPVNPTECTYYDDWLQQSTAEF